MNPVHINARYFAGTAYVFEIFTRFHGTAYVFEIFTLFHGMAYVFEIFTLFHYFIIQYFLWLENTDRQSGWDHRN